MDDLGGVLTHYFRKHPYGSKKKVEDKGAVMKLWKPGPKLHAPLFWGKFLKTDHRFAVFEFPPLLGANLNPNKWWFEHWNATLDLFFFGVMPPPKKAKKRVQKQKLDGQIIQILIRFSIIFTIHFGVPLFLETSRWWLKRPIEKS